MKTHLKHLAAAAVAVLTTASQAATPGDHVQFSLSPEFIGFLARSGSFEPAYHGTVTQVAQDSSLTHRVDTSFSMFIAFGCDCFDEVPSVMLENLSLNLAEQKVYGDFTSWRYLSPPPLEELKNVPLFDVGQVVQANGSITLSQLTITPELLPSFVEGWWLEDAHAQALAALPTLGTITVSPVPEPSAYALLGVGLVGVQLGLRRRHRAACAEA